MAVYSNLSGSIDGDPDKAAEAIVNVVRGEGVAKGSARIFFFCFNQQKKPDSRNDQV
jgi:hypothetical protein